jgi:heme-degrading monooxygenase HmoA
LFARVSTYEFPVEHCDDAVEAFRRALAEIRTMPGLTDAYFFVDRETGHGQTVTFWDSPETMAASRVRASRLRTDAASAVEGGVQSSNEYEVCVHETGAALAETA